MNDNIRRASIFFLVSFLILVLNLTYFQIVVADTVAGHPGNTRAIQSEMQIERGRIFDRNGLMLADNDKVGLEYRRRYPFDDLTSGITGFNSVRFGRSGLEESFNKYLLGKKKVASFEEYLARLREEPRGHDVWLTLDTRVQEAAAEALEDRTGAVVAIDPRSGELIAAVTFPRYNPNTVEADWAVLSKDPGKPLFNRATQGLYPPGSTFKIITAAAALEAGLASPTKTYTGPNELRVHGGKVTNYAGQGCGTLTLAGAFAKSCNTIFAQIGLELEAERLVRFARRFGLDKRVDLEVRTSQSTIPNAGEMDPLDLAWSSVGQGRTLVTPVQMGMIGAAIAGNGRIYEPRLVKEVRDRKGHTLLRPAAKVFAQPLLASEALAVRELMVQTVEAGTGLRAKIAGVTVGGKTGTAEPADKKRTHAWFVGFAPAENPEIVVAVIVEHAGEGGRVAAPIAKRVMEEALGLASSSE